jgi:hypothetical protein
MALLNSLIKRYTLARLKYASAKEGSIEIAMVKLAMAFS